VTTGNQFIQVPYRYNKEIAPYTHAYALIITGAPRRGLIAPGRARTYPRADAPRAYSRTDPQAGRRGNLVPDLS
jgi:hypothetical protein